MPVAVARKIEFELYRRELLDLDIQVRPIVLTHEQCVEYQLPRIPLKETERRAEAFETRQADKHIIASGFEGGKPAGDDAGIERAQIFDNRNPILGTEIAKLLFALQWANPDRRAVLRRNVLVPVMMQ
jgi:hypothetical protein